MPDGIRAEAAVLPEIPGVGTVRQTLRVADYRQSASQREVAVTVRGWRFPL